jgi:ribosomal subunit interface protein
MARLQWEEVTRFMQLTITGKQVELGEALRNRVDTSLGAILEKYFKTAVEAHVVVTKEAHLFRTEISLRIGRGIMVNAGATAPGIGGAFDAAAERIAKQLRRHKRRLRAHHARTREGGETGGRARIYVPERIAEDAEHDTADAGGGPAVVAEMITELPCLTVGEAVMRMDLAEAPVLLFRNPSGEINAVYRRTDGNIGWIDPELDPAIWAAKRHA